MDAVWVVTERIEEGDYDTAYGYDRVMGVFVTQEMATRYVHRNLIAFPSTDDKEVITIRGVPRDFSIIRTYYR